MILGAPPDKESDVNRPLLVIDGDSFAHRAYHGVPKSIRRHGNKSGGAILGFANFLLRLYVQEQPRAVLVGWDTLDTPTYRHRALETYQSGRVFDLELLDQLDVLPEFVAACGRVGEDVATLTPHRPGRADFPHPVLHERGSLTAAYPWRILTEGSGWRARSALKRAHGTPPPRCRRDNHLRQTRTA